MQGLEILTPADPRLHGGITSFRYTGHNSASDNIAIAKRLLDEHRIFSVQRNGPARGACVRITPALFNSADDIDALVRALRSFPFACDLVVLEPHQPDVYHSSLLQAALDG